MKKIKLLLLALTVSIIGYTQNIKDLERYSLQPKNEHVFPPDYKIALPTLAFPEWDMDYDRYIPYLTNTLRRTQITLGANIDGVNTQMTANSIIPHAQLDTTTIIKDPGQLLGTWRMVAFRSVRFNDSVTVVDKQYYRLPPVILHDKSKDDAYIIFSKKRYSLIVKEAGERRFNTVITPRYAIENRRYLMLYNLMKADGGVSQIGIDENGYLIINYPKVIEYVKKGVYMSYYTIIDQYILEKVKQ